MVTDSLAEILQEIKLNDTQRSVLELLSGAELTPHQKSILKSHLSAVTEGDNYGHAKHRYARDERGSQANPTMPEVYNSGYILKFSPLLEYMHAETAVLLRPVLIGIYLLSDEHEFLDERAGAWERVSRLVGELHRWEAREQKIPTKKAQLTAKVVGDYCKTFQLQKLQPYMMQSLGFHD